VRENRILVEIVLSASDLGNLTPAQFLKQNIILN
jgi:hypothetical protein